MIDNNLCPLFNSKNITGRKLIDLALDRIRQNLEGRMNLIWLEATGCSGNIISLLNAENPDVAYLFKKMVNLRYSNSLMQAEGERAYEQFLETLSTDFILVVEGAAALKNNGLYNIVASYEGRYITAMEAVKQAGEKAKYVLAVGTCASFGGPSAAQPNPSESVGIDKILEREVIKFRDVPVILTGLLAQLLIYYISENLSWMN